MSLSLSNKDEIIMRLVHYFVTEENYQPIVVNGVQNEIWLENIEASYRIIRINSNYIHNNDQLGFDLFKIKNIAKQIKRKTFSLKMNTLNILLDLNADVDMEYEKGIETYKIDSLKDVRNDTGLAGIFPKLKTFTLKKGDNLDFIVNITNDINEKTEEENKNYDNIFKEKKIVITKVIMGVCILCYLMQMFVQGFESALLLNPAKVLEGEYWRLITAAFLHGSPLHLFVNMYALNIIGTQVENFMGKKKYLAVYFGSAITASMMSAAITSTLSLGASGAIFGLLGALAYFGYHFRLYIGGALRQIIPVILINLFIGFMIPFVDNAAHIGGLIGGGFLAMALGIGKKDEGNAKIHGRAIFTIYILFLGYLLFFS